MGSWWRFFAIGFVLSTLLAACDESEQPDVDESASPTSVYAVGLAPCTNEATVEAVRSENGTRLATPLETLEAGLDRRFFLRPDDDIQCRLRRALLGLDDLPDGWAFSLRSQSFDPVFDDRAELLCGLPYPDAVAGVGVDFEPADSEDFALVSHRLALLEPQHAQHLMAAVRRTCVDRGDDGPDGGLHYAISELDGFGDEAIAIEEWYGQEKTFSVWHILERRGDLVSQMTVGSEDNSVEPTQLARTISERVPDIGPIPEPTPYPGAGCGPGESPEEVIEKDDSLAKGLVVIDDLEPGWVEDPPSKCGFVAGEGFCENREDVEYPEPQAYAGTSFIRSGIGSHIGFSTRIESYGGGRAKKLLEMIGERNKDSNSCEASIDDDSFTWNFEPIPSLLLGDESQSWIVTTKGYPGQQEIWLFVSWIRRADQVAVLVYFTGGFELLGSGARDFELERFQKLALVVDSKFATLD